MADVDVPEVAGLEMLEGQLKLTGLNRNGGCFYGGDYCVYKGQGGDKVEVSG